MEVGSVLGQYSGELYMMSLVLGQERLSSWLVSGSQQHERLCCCEQLRGLQGGAVNSPGKFHKHGSARAERNIYERES